MHTPLQCEAHFQVKNAQRTPCSEHFLKLRCRKKCTRRCGAKHISKSKCTKRTMLGALLEVEVSKKCTKVWREAHFEVKMCKAHCVPTAFGRSIVPHYATTTTMTTTTTTKTTTTTTTTTTPPPPPSTTATTTTTNRTRRGGSCLRDLL